MEQFHGVPVWHVSVAVQPVARVSEWLPAEHRKAEYLLRQLVVGVGRAKGAFMEDPHPAAIALHLRVPATSEEEDTVGGARDTRCEHGQALWTPS